MVRYLSLAVIAVILCGGIWATWLHRQSQRSVETMRCASAIRAKYPGSYDDLTDAVLVQKAEAKYPNICAH